MRNLVASLGDAASAYVLASPTEALGDVPYASVPVCLDSFSGVRKMFNLIVYTGQNGVRKLLTICKDPAGHLLTAGPRPSTGPELTISTRLSYGREPVSTIADVRDAMRWRRGLEMLCVQLHTERSTPETRRRSERDARLQRPRLDRVCSLAGAYVVWSVGTRRSQPPGDAETGPPGPPHAAAPAALSWTRCLSVQETST